MQFGPSKPISPARYSGWALDKWARVRQADIQTERRQAAQAVPPPANWQTKIKQTKKLNKTKPFLLYKQDFLIQNFTQKNVFFPIFAKGI